MKPEFVAIWHVFSGDRFITNLSVPSPVTDDRVKNALIKALNCDGFTVTRFRCDEISGFEHRFGLYISLILDFAESEIGHG